MAVSEYKKLGHDMVYSTQNYFTIRNKTKTVNISQDHRVAALFKVS